MKQFTFLSDNKISWRQGKQWFDQGVVDFKQLKNYWYIACLLFAVMLVLVTSIVPAALPFLIIFLSPMMTAFMMGLCQQQSNQQPVNPRELLSAIQNKLGDFLLLGVISAILSLLFQQIHIQLLGMLGLPVEVTSEMVDEMSGKEAFVRAILNLMTNIPVAMALAFSPALLLFKRERPFNAVKFSFLGVLKGWRGFLVLMLLFMLVFMAVVVLASLVLSVVVAVLGAASHVVGNIIVFFFVLTVAGIGICAQYQAYNEIFNQTNTDKEENGAEIYTEI